MLNTHFCAVFCVRSVLIIFIFLAAASMQNAFAYVTSQGCVMHWTGNGIDTPGGVAELGTAESMTKSWHKESECDDANIDTCEQKSFSLSSTWEFTESKWHNFETRDCTWQTREYLGVYEYTYNADYDPEQTVRTVERYVQIGSTFRDFTTPP